MFPWKFFELKKTSPHEELGVMILIPDEPKVGNTCLVCILAISQRKDWPCLTRSKPNTIGA